MYRYRFTGESPKEWAGGVLKPGDEFQSEQPLYNGEIEYIGGEKPPPWLPDVTVAAIDIKPGKRVDQPPAKTTPKEG